MLWLYDFKVEFILSHWICLCWIMPLEDLQKFYLLIWIIRFKIFWCFEQHLGTNFWKFGANFILFLAQILFYFWRYLVLFLAIFGFIFWRYFVSWSQTEITNFFKEKVHCTDDPKQCDQIGWFFYLWATF